MFISNLIFFLKCEYASLGQVPNFSRCWLSFLPLSSAGKGQKLNYFNFGGCREDLSSKTAVQWTNNLWRTSLQTDIFVDELVDNQLYKKQNFFFDGVYICRNHPYQRRGGNILTSWHRKWIPVATTYRPSSYRPFPGVDIATWPFLRVHTATWPTNLQLRKLLEKCHRWRRYFLSICSAPFFSQTMLLMYPEHK
jgi:hypothetical protein